jgi:hypothetical protein
MVMELGEPLDIADQDIELIGLHRGVVRNRDGSRELEVFSPEDGLWMTIPGYFTSEPDAQCSHREAGRDRFDA